MPKNTEVTCLNDYQPVALTSVAMKCFERLVIAHINTIIPETLDPLQFAYLPNRSTDDAIMGPQIIKRFYSCTIESILTGCITAWYGN